MQIAIRVRTVQANCWPVGPTKCDKKLGENEVINFNAGDHGISVSMQYRDHIAVEKPELGSFAE